MNEQLRWRTALVVLGFLSLADAQQRSRGSACSSIGTGGNAVQHTGGVTGICAVRSEELEALVRDRDRDWQDGSKSEVISVLAQRLDLDQGQIRAAVDILREKEIPPERLAARLGDIAERLKAIQVTA